ncbi:MAG: hypothetical protein FJW64_02820 [Actinobacteria bacterium]|nr:hypothetical protein [Actinomycetota bacterium]
MLVPMGRPSKGDRVPITTKPIRPFADVIRENADKLHMSYGDYVLHLAAHAYGRPEWAPEPGVTGDMLEELLMEDFPQVNAPVTVSPLAALPRPTSKELPTQIAS